MQTEIFIVVVQKEDFQTEEITQSQIELALREETKAGYFSHVTVKEL